MTNVYLPQQQQQRPNELTPSSGLPSSEKDLPCAKYVQFMDASHQERAIHIEKLIEIYANAIDSIFQINNNPKVKMVPTRAFIQTILKKSQSNYSAVQTSLFYLFRVKYAVQQIKRKTQLTSMENMMCCGRRMFLASLMTASKYLQDKNYRNSAWSKITNLPLEEINTLEIAFLKLIDYKLYVSKPTFDRWYTKLHEHIQIKSGQHSLNSTIVTKQQQQQQQQQQHQQQPVQSIKPIIVNVVNQHTHQMMMMSPPISPVMMDNSSNNFGMSTPPSETSDHSQSYTTKRRPSEDLDNITLSKKQCM